MYVLKAVSALNETLITISLLNLVMINKKITNLTYLHY